MTLGPDLGQQPQGLFEGYGERTKDAWYRLADLSRGPHRGWFWSVLGLLLVGGGLWAVLMLRSDPDTTVSPTAPAFHRLRGQVQVQWPTPGTWTETDNVYQGHLALSEGVCTVLRFGHDSTLRLQGRCLFSWMAADAAHPPVLSLALGRAWIHLAHSDAVWVKCPFTQIEGAPGAELEVSLRLKTRLRCVIRCRDGAATVRTKPVRRRRKKANSKAPSPSHPGLRLRTRGLQIPEDVVQIEAGQGVGILRNGNQVLRYVAYKTPDDAWQRWNLSWREAREVPDVAP